VLVFSAPDEDRLRMLLAAADRSLFRATIAVSLAGRKLRWDYGAEAPVDAPAT
jgi:hypothetical protein